MSGELLNPHDHDRGILNEQRIEALEKLIGERFTAHGRVHELESEARSLALVEILRRLDGLNHADAEADRVLNTYGATYLPRELFDTYVQNQRRYVFAVLTLLVAVLAIGVTVVVAVTR